jgi:hypothetical protein
MMTIGTNGIRTIDNTFLIVPDVRHDDSQKGNQNHRLVD